MLRRVLPLTAVVFLTLPLPAALPPLSPEQLRAASEAVVVGEVIDFRSEEKARGKGVIDTIFAVRVKVRVVEKAPDKHAIPSGSMITIQGSNLLRSPSGWAGPSGNHTVDYKQSLRAVLELTRTKRIEARFYLNVHDGRFSLLTPNGLEVLAVRDRN